MKDNCIYGTISSEIWKLSGLREINFEWNALSGSVGSEIYELTLLNRLKLAINENKSSCNHTDGTVTEVDSTGLQGNILGRRIGQLSGLIEIAVAANNFNPAISPEIGALKKLGGMRRFILFHYRNEYTYL